MTGPSGLAIAEILDKPDAAAGAESGGRDEIATNFIFHDLEH